MKPRLAGSERKTYGDVDARRRGRDHCEEFGGKGVLEYGNRDSRIEETFCYEQEGQGGLLMM